MAASSLGGSDFSVRLGNTGSQVSLGDLAKCIQRGNGFGRAINWIKLGLLTGRSVDEKMIKGLLGKMTLEQLTAVTMKWQSSLGTLSQEIISSRMRLKQSVHEKGLKTMIKWVRGPSEDSWSKPLKEKINQYKKENPHATDEEINTRLDQEISHEIENSDFPQKIIDKYFTKESLKGSLLEEELNIQPRKFSLVSIGSFVGKGLSVVSETMRNIFEKVLSKKENVAEVQKAVAEAPQVEKKKFTSITDKIKEMTGYKSDGKYDDIESRALALMKKPGVKGVVLEDFQATFPKERDFAQLEETIQNLMYDPSIEKEADLVKQIKTKLAEFKRIFEGYFFSSGNPPIEDLIEHSVIELYKSYEKEQIDTLVEQNKDQVLPMPSNFDDTTDGILEKVEVAQGTEYVAGSGREAKMELGEPGVLMHEKGPDLAAPELPEVASVPAPSTALLTTESILEELRKVDNPYKLTPKLKEALESFFHQGDEAQLYVLQSFVDIENADIELPSGIKNFTLGAVLCGRAGPVVQKSFLDQLSQKPSRYKDFIYAGYARAMAEEITPTGVWNDAEIEKALKVFGSRYDQLPR